MATNIKTTATTTKWEVWHDGQKLAEYSELHLAMQFIGGFGEECELQRTVNPSDLADVLESIDS